MTFILNNFAGARRVKKREQKRAKIKTGKSNAVPRIEMKNLSLGASSPSWQNVPSVGFIPLFISYRYLFYRHETDDMYSVDHGLQFLILTFLVVIGEKVLGLKPLLWTIAFPVLLAIGVCRALSKMVAG